MKDDSTRRLSIDFITADLDDPGALTALLVNYVLRPARRLYGMFSPRPDETDELTQGRREDLGDGHYLMLRIEDDLDESVAKFDPFVRGFVLLARLFPHVFEEDVFERTLRSPAETFFARSHSVAYLLWADIACLVGGLLRRDGPSRPLNRGIRGDYDPAPNDEGLVELREIQVLLRRATKVPDDTDEHYWRIDIGLRPMDGEVAARLDQILQSGARQRLIWFADEQYGYQREPDGSYSSILAGWSDRGVFPTVVPQSISAVFALDFIETLALDRRTGICAHCDRPLLLGPVQAARVRDGKPVYHEDCHHEHRRRYIRAWQQANDQNQPGRDSHTTSRLSP